MAFQHEDVTRGREIIARWHALAEQRLEHLAELYESGRWRRYHSELSFLENIHEARAAVETWRLLMETEANPDNSPFDMSWLGRAPSSRQPSKQPMAVRLLPRRIGEDPLMQVDGERPNEAPGSAQRDAEGESILMPPVERVVPDDRYPVLRNRL